MTPRSTETPSDVEADAATVHRLSTGIPTGLIAPKLAHDPPSIEDVERRRTHLWIVAGILLLGISTAVVVLFLREGPGAVVPESPALRWSFLGISIAYILYAVDQERNLRRLTNALIDERVLTTALQARIADLTTLTTVGRVVNSVLTLEEVLEVVLRSAFELTGARSGSVMLLDDDDELRVAASTGSQPAPRGATISLGSGVAGWVGAQREPVLINGTVQESQFPGRGERHRRAGSSVIAPLIAGGDLLGVLAVERPPDARPFEPAEMRSVALFAEHAATAVRNAQRYAEERHTAERLTDVLEQRSEFVATMVHEIKRPLTALLGFADLLETRAADLDPEQREQALQSVLEQAQRIQKMIDEVLRTSSVEAGASLRVADVDVCDLAATAVSDARVSSVTREGEERPITFRCHDGPAIVRGDPDALSRVLGNLLDNAMKYSESGTAIDVDAEQWDNEVIVAVRDRGKGIAADELDSIFERFRRRDYTILGGVGLGLYIVRSLVQSHGGDVEVRSTVGEGSTFTVRLPLRQSAPAPADGGAPTGSPS